MAKRHEELIDSLNGKGLLAAIGRYLLILGIVSAVAVYIGFLLFGTNSLEVLFQLNVTQKNLERSIKYLKAENARLQKEYFELKELEPTE
ncbi:MULTISPECIES: hypothetical protein [unclassified Nitratiruptor]|uniref:hypothetical protein n=1 Tax=unclassified Nitratiruptor TaxID=2624044 RepID=UPI001915AF31|nr:MULTISPECIES: hypothetical protein [unclassified Nitratiruptor]BCD60957.1 hypothetical protein NitYY0810_C1735 [Nitratiruptor sp. YY08-10]BCD64889.1 hypothetical protein NitYY0814_C1743 [Nitratiruptor sp. YY08-14]